MVRRGGVVLLFLLWAGVASAGPLSPFRLNFKKDEVITEFQSEFVNYEEIKKDVENSEAELGASYGVSLGFRFHTIFTLSGVYRANEHYDRTSGGIAVKMYIPGIFFMGGGYRDLARAATRNIFLTYVGYEILNTSAYNKNDAKTVRGIETTTRMGLEIGHIWGGYIFGWFGATSFVGNYDLSTCSGFGFHF